MKPTPIERNKAAGFIRVVTRKGSMKIYFDIILWIEGVDNYTKFHLVGGKHILTGITISRIMDRLDERFFRIHKGHAVNLNHVKAVYKLHRPLGVELKNNTRLPVSRRTTPEFRRIWNQKNAHGHA
ncbi:LytR/AlgR family response regulator transcription factor [Tellurirhabdus bombi]|uniref:LytR/AlgR family response regulator transcription factor n=1 Tax=Tellurirhabdus bombi TaxID=2907205 RepID=UPI001F1B88E1|nr:LytTR family DNA-binding domain-containing protein [Tellurirhabdus bombi]